MPANAEDEKRRLGDSVDIAGDYQHRALHEGHPVQRFWHRSKLLLLDTLLQPRPGERILDVGCGSGVCCGHLARRGASATGVDVNATALTFARRTYGPRGVRVVRSYVDSLPFADASFDKAICLEVIEHLHVPQVAVLLQSAWRVLVPGGTLLVTTPNYRSLWPVIEFALDRTRRVPTLAGEQHVTRFTSPRLTDLARAAGFQPLAQRSICTVGPWLAPLSQSLAVRSTEFELQYSVPGGTILAHLYQKPHRK
jgi:2-polyprenyl-3-methyl-5-hydroxy-6-metoxy-1,4-benzoquinol methylase